MPGRVCAICGSAYSDEVARCPVDGTPLGRPGVVDDSTLPMRAIGGPMPPPAREPAPAPEASPLLGRRLEAGVMVGEYQIESLLEEGGMGTVYRAVHPVIGKHVAIKVLAALLSQDETMATRFIHEARAVNEIQHDNIVDIFGFGRLPDGRLYYVMELLSGQSLKARRKQTPPLRYDETLSILAQVCDALAAAHQKGIIHRDLKPDNVFLVEGKGLRTVKLLDFGIAKLIRREQVGRKTEAGLLMGTPQYMSPEQCLSKDLDVRTDVYSLGVIMFELFTGRVPFEGKTAIEVINGHLQQPPPAPKDLARVPSDLNDLVLACLAKEPEKRPANMAELRERLLEISISQALGLDAGLPLAISLSGGGATPIPTESGAAAPPAPGAAAAAAAPAPIATQVIERRPRRLPWPIRFFGGVIVVAFAIFGVWMAIDRLRAPSAPPVGAPQVALQILSEPPGATVIIDGKRQALLTPYVFQLPWRDRVHVRLELAGYQPHEESVALSLGEREKAVRAVLAPFAGDAGVGAASDGGRATPKKGAGAATMISDLRLRPAAGVLAERNTIAGELHFDDADGDVRAVVTQVRSAAGAIKSSGRVRLNVVGATTGSAAFSFVFQPAAAEPHRVEVWVLDEAGNASNHLTATLEVQDKEKEKEKDKDGDRDAGTAPSGDRSGDRSGQK